MRTKAVFAALLPIILLASSCGRFGGTYIPRAPESAYSRSSATVSPYTEGEAADYSCPSQPNIVPEYDRQLDGSGYFRVCANPNEPAKILIHGQTALSNKVCIFPAQMVDTRRIYWKPELQSGLPWVQCLEATEGGVQATFENITYNAAYIVEEMHADQMQLCLGNGNYYGCPPYSFGRFR